MLLNTFFNRVAVSDLGGEPPLLDLTLASALLVSMEDRRLVPTFPISLYLSVRRLLEALGDLLVRSCSPRLSPALPCWLLRLTVRRRMGLESSTNAWAALYFWL